MKTISTVLIAIIATLSTVAAPTPSVDLEIRTSRDVDGKGRVLWRGRKSHDSVQTYPDDKRQERLIKMKIGALATQNYDIRLWSDTPRGSDYSYSVREENIQFGKWDSKKWDVRFLIRDDERKWHDITDRVVNWRRYTPNFKGFFVNDWTELDYGKSRLFRVSITPTNLVAVGDSISIGHTALDLGTFETDVVFSVLKITR